VSAVRRSRGKGGRWKAADKDVAKAKDRWRGLAYNPSGRRAVSPLSGRLKLARSPAESPAL
jgi:hypothetical protein